MSRHCTKRAVVGIDLEFRLLPGITRNKVLTLHCSDHEERFCDQRRIGRVFQFRDTHMTGRIRRRLVNRQNEPVGPAAYKCSGIGPVREMNPGACRPRESGENQERLRGGLPVLQMIYQNYYPNNHEKYAGQNSFHSMILARRRNVAKDLEIGVVPLPSLWREYPTLPRCNIISGIWPLKLPDGSTVASSIMKNNIYRCVFRAPWPTRHMTHRNMVAVRRRGRSHKEDKSHPMMEFYYGAIKRENGSNRIDRHLVFQLQKRSPAIFLTAGLQSLLNGDCNFYCILTSFSRLSKLAAFI